MSGLSAHDLHVAIEQRYMLPEWHVEREFTYHQRRLDCVAFNLWASRGYRIVGFEIKVDRGDWLKELANFQKNEEWMAVVDSFWIVTPPKLVKSEELPEGWGHLELVGTRMMTRKHAPQKTPNREMPRELALRLMQRLVMKDETERRSLEYDIRRQVSNELRKNVDADVQRELDNLRTAHQDSERRYRELLSAAGWQPHEWHAHEKALRAAKMVAEIGGDTMVLKRQLGGAIESLDKHLANLRQAHDALQ